MMALYSAVQRAFHTRGTDSYRIVNYIVAALIGLSISLFVLELVIDVLPPGLAWVDEALLVLFVLELVCRVGTWDPPVLGVVKQTRSTRLRTHLYGRLGYLMKPLNLVDLVTVLALVPALRGLRALRLLRLVRGTRFFRHATPLQGAMRAFEDNALLYAGALSIVGLQVILGGISLWIVENELNPGVNSIGDGIWWAIVTLTTVGFGDIAPVTTMGRVFASVLMLGGMFTLALFAGIIGHSLLHAVLSVREEQFRMSKIVDHIVICGYDRGARLLLDAITAEFDPERHPVVIFAPHDRPDDIPASLRWVKGDPTKDSELDKVRPTLARAVIIVGSRLGSPQEADALTILTTFTLRAYLRSQPETPNRIRPLYVVAEILDGENVGHCHAAGADEVIETTRLGFSLVAHAISMPGTARIMSEVATVGAHSLYVGRLTGQEFPTTFRELAARLKASDGLLLIGLRDGVAGQDVINPADDTPVAAGQFAIYLAPSAVLPPLRAVLKR